MQLLIIACPLWITLKNPQRYGIVFPRSKDGLFEMTWCEDGSVAFLANNGKFVGTKKSGHLFANCEKGDDNACYYFYLINRPVLVLKCDQGFVGYKSSSSNKLECNKANYEMIVVERTDKGMVYLKGKANTLTCMTGCWKWFIFPISRSKWQVLALYRRGILRQWRGSCTVFYWAARPDENMHQNGGWTVLKQWKEWRHRSRRCQCPTCHRMGILTWFFHQIF